jgi:hypothetical protein
MIARGDAEVVRQDLYDQQFVVLTPAARYDRQTGLRADAVNLSSPGE